MFKPKNNENELNNNVEEDNLESVEEKKMSELEFNKLNSRTLKIKYSKWNNTDSDDYDEAKSKSKILKDTVKEISSQETKNSTSELEKEIVDIINNSEYSYILSDTFKKIKLNTESECNFFEKIFNFLIQNKVCSNSSELFIILVDYLLIASYSKDNIIKKYKYIFDHLSKLNQIRIKEDIIS